MRSAGRLTVHGQRPAPPSAHLQAPGRLHGHDAVRQHVSERRQPVALGPKVIQGREDLHAACARPPPSPNPTSAPDSAGCAVRSILMLAGPRLHTPAVKQRVERADAGSRQALSVSSVACGACACHRGRGGAPGPGRPTPHQTPRRGTPAGRRPGRARWAPPPRACPPPPPPARRGRASRLRGARQGAWVMQAGTMRGAGVMTRAPGACLHSHRFWRPARRATPACIEFLPALSVQLRQACRVSQNTRPLQAAHTGRTVAAQAMDDVATQTYHAARRRGCARPLAAARVPARTLPCTPPRPAPRRLRGAPRLHAAGRVLDDQAVGRRGAQLGRGRAEAVRRRLAVPHLVAAVRHLRARGAAAASRRGPGAPLSVQAAAFRTEGTKDQTEHAVLPGPLAPRCAASCQARARARSELVKKQGRPRPGGGAPGRWSAGPARRARPACAPWSRAACWSPARPARPRGAGGTAAGPRRASAARPATCRPPRASADCSAPCARC